MSITKRETRVYGKIRVAHDGPVARITLFNPERRNAMGPQMVNELLYALDDAHADGDVRAIVITGEGKSFCAGGDFAQMTGGAEEQQLPPKGDYVDLILALMRTEKPIVARVNGAAMGGGLGIVAASTFAVASLGRKLDATEAASIGLVSSAVDADSLDAEVKKLTDALVEKSPKAMALGLAAFAKQDDMALADALPMLRTSLAECLATEDAREGLMAFLEKRKPVWKGR